MMMAELCSTHLESAAEMDQWQSEISPELNCWTCDIEEGIYTAPKKHQPPVLAGASSKTEQQWESHRFQKIVVRNEGSAPLLASREQLSHIMAIYIIGPSGMILLRNQSL